MKRAALAIFAFYFVAIQFKGDLLNYWLPAVGVAVNHGYVWPQFFALTVVSALAFGGGVVVAYQTLGRLLD